MPNNDLNLGFGEEISAGAPTIDDGLVEVTWPIITIDEVDGLPNFETVGVNGYIHKIMRGVEVTVHPSVVGVLKHAVGTKYKRVEGGDGRIRNEPYEGMLIPWRQVGTEKLRVTSTMAERGY